MQANTEEGERETGASCRQSREAIALFSSPSFLSGCVYCLGFCLVARHILTATETARFLILIAVAVGQ